MRHFNNKRELVEGEPCEFWDDTEYIPSADSAWHYWMQDKYKKERERWYKKMETAKQHNDKITGEITPETLSPERRIVILLDERFRKLERDVLRLELEIENMRYYLCNAPNVPKE